MMGEKELPEGWAQAQLRDVAHAGGTCNPKANGEGEFFYVDIEAVNNTSQKIVAPKLLQQAQAPSRARMSIKTNDIIFSLVRPYLKNIAIVPQELDNQVASTAFCVLRPENNILSQYIFYILLQDAFISSIPTYGNSPPAARDEEFWAMPIPLAPLAEQQRIVEAIEQQFSRLDDAVALLRASQKRLKLYRASVLKAAVEGRLTAEWRAVQPDLEPASVLLQEILTERRAKWEEEQVIKGRDLQKMKYEEPAEPDVIGLAKLPEGWCWATVEQLAEVGTGATPLKSKTEYYVNGTIPWVTSGSLNGDFVTVVWWRSFCKT